MTYIVRLANLSDLDDLQAIEVSAATRFAGLNLIDHLLDSSIPRDMMIGFIENGLVWMGCIDSVSVGFAVASIATPVCTLLELDVLPEHGGRGLGRMLVARVVEHARDNECTTIILSTFAEVPWNAPFYRKLGFTEILEEDLSEDLLIARAEEVASGLPVEKRVFMQLCL